MKKLTLVALCALSALLLGSCSQKDTIRIISYNIRLSGVDDGTNSWQYRKQATLNMIAEEQPTLFGLQEATPEQMAHTYQLARAWALCSGSDHLVA